MRWAIALAVVVAVVMVTHLFSIQRSAGKIDYHLLSLIPLMLFGIAPYLYGAHLADRDHTKDPEKYRRFTGTNNVPIFSALFRASQRGDRAATWSLVMMFALPFLFMLIVFAPAIERRLFN